MTITNKTLTKAQSDFINKYKLKIVESPFSLAFRNEKNQEVVCVYYRTSQNFATLFSRCKSKFKKMLNIK